MCAGAFRTWGVRDGCGPGRAGTGDTVVIGPAPDRQGGDEQREGRQPDADDHGLAVAATGQRTSGCGRPGPPDMTAMAVMNGRPVRTGDTAPTDDAGRSGVEVAAGAPAEHALGEEQGQTGIEVTELLGGVPAVRADRQMPAHFRQQGAAAAQGDVQEPVVEAAFLGGREFPVSAHTTGTELLARLFQRGRRGDHVDAQQTSGYVYGFGLDLGMPEKALRGAGKGPKCVGGEPPAFRWAGLCRAQSATAGGFAQFRQDGAGGGVRGPGADRVAHGDEQLRPQGAAGHANSAGRRTGEHLPEGRGGDELGGGTGGGQADHGMVEGGPPVPGEQQRDGVMTGVGVRAAEPGEEGGVGLPGGAGHGWVGRAWGVRGLHGNISFPAAGPHARGRPVEKQCLSVHTCIAKGPAGRRRPPLPSRGEAHLGTGDSQETRSRNTPAVKSELPAIVTAGISGRRSTWRPTSRRKGRMAGQMSNSGIRTVRAGPRLRRHPVKPWPTHRRTLPPLRHGA